MFLFLLEAIIVIFLVDINFWCIDLDCMLLEDRALTLCKMFKPMMCFPVNSTVQLTSFFGIVWVELGHSGSTL